MNFLNIMESYSTNRDINQCVYDSKVRGIITSGELFYLICFYVSCVYLCPVFTHFLNVYPYFINITSMFQSQ